MASRPFAPSAHEPAKRTHQINVRFSDKEMELISKLADQQGCTVPNLVRILVGLALANAFMLRLLRRMRAKI